MLGIGKYAQIILYIEYAIYTCILILWIKGCQLFRKYLSDAANNKFFGSWLTDINEVRKRIDYILDVVFFLFRQSGICHK